MASAPPIPERSDSLVSNQSAVQDITGTSDNVSGESNGKDSPECRSPSPADTSSILEFEDIEAGQEFFNTINQFYSQGDLCDVEIMCGDRSFRCHRLVLACVSGYFRSMFMANMAESKQEVVNIQDIDENVLEKIIEFAYGGKITLSTENVQSVLYTASILQIERVARACSDFMKEHLDPNNCVEAHTFAEQHNRTELLEYTQEYITEHFGEISKMPAFTSVSLGLLEGLLDCRRLNVSSEVAVYEAVMKWVEKDVENRKEHLSSLIARVKLPLMDMAYLMETVATNALIRSNLECRDYLDEAKHYQMWLADLVADVKITQRTRPRHSYAGALFCVGGRGAAGDPYKSIECYNPLKDKWFQVTEMHTRRRHVGVCSEGGVIYAVGGHNGTKHLSTGEMFDPSTGKWKKIATMNIVKTGVRGLGLSCLGGAIYAVGGLDDKNCFNTVERYDPACKSWFPAAPMNSQRGGVGLAALKGFLYAIGGNNGSASLCECEKYNPYVNKWTEIAPMKSRRAGAGVGVLDGCIYAVGGFDDNNSLDTCEKYDPRTDTWTSVAKLSCPRGGVGVAALGGLLYAVGGHDGCNYLNSVESYNPLTNMWRGEASIEIARAGAGVVLLPGHVGDILEAMDIAYHTTAGGAGGKL